MPAGRTLSLNPERTQPPPLLPPSRWLSWSIGHDHHIFSSRGGESDVPFHGSEDMDSYQVGNPFHHHHHCCFQWWLRSSSADVSTTSTVLHGRPTWKASSLLLSASHRPGHTAAVVCGFEPMLKRKYERNHPCKTQKSTHNHFVCPLARNITATNP